jgi:hypothetical protein
MLFLPSERHRLRHPIDKQAAKSGAYARRRPGIQFAGCRYQGRPRVALSVSVQRDDRRAYQVVDARRHRPNWVSVDGGYLERGSQVAVNPGLCLDLASLQASRGELAASSALVGAACEFATASGLQRSDKASNTPRSPPPAVASGGDIRLSLASPGAGARHQFVEDVRHAWSDQRGHPGLLPSYAAPSRSPSRLGPRPLAS